jgi:hypothetical protein
MIRSLASLVVVGVLALGAFAARDASALAKSPWDQAKVTAIAKEFADSATAVEDIVRKEPAVAAQAQEYWRLRQQLRRIKNESRELATELGAGKGHDETVGIYENLLSEILYARDSAQRLYLTGSVNDRIKAARAVLEKLAPYYDARPLPPPLAS